MSPLRQALADYLMMRRALGYKLDCAERLLGQFITFLEDRAAVTITIDAAVAWATQPGGSRVWWALRLSTVRSFARYLHTLDPACEVPPHGLLAVHAERHVPYLYTDAEITALMNATTMIAAPFGAATIRTLIGLLAVTGIRIGEALAADVGDLDRDAGTLLVHGKYDKTRLVALHPSAVVALGEYLDRGDRPVQRPDCQALFLSSRATRVRYPCFSRRFTRLVADAGLEPRSPHCHPRPHDLRHSFAVSTLLGWFAAGLDVDAKLPLLSTYLGHVKPKDTYWYLTGSPELLALAGQRLERTIEETS
ncbi:MAG: tyrosine-type recombinase/integrase [Solirubrobacteraceae bacterium]